MLYPRVAALLGAILLAVVPACSDPTDIAECHGQIDLSVTPGPAPVFNWTPECMIAYLVIDDRGDGTGYWTVSSPPGQNIIAPPVTYGVVPQGSTEDLGPNPLEPGGAYLAIAFLTQRDQSGDLIPIRIGELAFNQ
jgi:hypothetical protein